jgi:predicted DNA-binding transcriptional regulator AlpA
MSDEACSNHGAKGQMSAPKLHIPVEPRGLRREMAAAYVGVSPSKFDDWITRGLMPEPKRVDSCVIWDRYRLDEAFERLSDAPPTGTDWDEALKWPRSA